MPALRTTAAAVDASRFRSLDRRQGRRRQARGHALPRLPGRAGGARVARAHRHCADRSVQVAVTGALVNGLPVALSWTTSAFQPDPPPPRFTRGPRIRRPRGPGARVRARSSPARVDVRQRGDDHALPVAARRPDDHRRHAFELSRPARRPRSRHRGPRDGDGDGRTGDGDTHESRRADRPLGARRLGTSPAGHPLSAGPPPTAAAGRRAGPAQAVCAGPASRSASHAPETRGANLPNTRASVAISPSSS